MDGEPQIINGVEDIDNSIYMRESIITDIINRYRGLSFQKNCVLHQWESEGKVCPNRNWVSQEDSSVPGLTPVSVV